MVIPVHALLLQQQTKGLEKKSGDTCGSAAADISADGGFAVTAAVAASSYWSCSRQLPLQREAPRKTQQQVSAWEGTPKFPIAMTPPRGPQEGPRGVCAVYEILSALP